MKKHDKTPNKAKTPKKMFKLSPIKPNNLGSKGINMVASMLIVPIELLAMVLTCEGNDSFIAIRSKLESKFTVNLDKKYMRIYRVCYEAVRQLRHPVGFIRYWRSIRMAERKEKSMLLERLLTFW